jgi:hypothetical protein
MSHDTTMLHSVSMVLGVHPAISVVKIGESGKKSSISRLFRQTLTPGIFIAEPGLPLEDGRPALTRSGLALPIAQSNQGFRRRGSKTQPFQPFEMLRTSNVLTTLAQISTSLLRKAVKGRSYGTSISRASKGVFWLASGRNPGHASSTIPPPFRSLNTPSRSSGATWPAA